MPVRVSNLRLGLDEPEAALPEQAARALGVDPSALRGWRILRKSLDARDKDRLNPHQPLAHDIAGKQGGAEQHDDKRRRGFQAAHKDHPDTGLGLRQPPRKPARGPKPAVTRVRPSGVKLR